MALASLAVQRICYHLWSEHPARTRLRSAAACDVRTAHRAGAAGGRRGCVFAPSHRRTVSHRLAPSHIGLRWCQRRFATHSWPLDTASAL